MQAKGQFQKHQVLLFITFKKQVPSKKHLKLKVGNLGSLYPDFSNISRYEGIT